VGLDESIELYSQAAKLLAACQKKIDAAQLKIEKINFQTPMQNPPQKEEEADGDGKL
ncbi:MAG: exodeoxyribonuclease VII small subunit, partial [Clostridium sp.]|nr:exodeoxyribonuclease VII small subunit [Clostridium sp.]